MSERDLNTLNLLVIDDNQIYAERIVSLLSYYYDDVNLGFLDDKQEFIKLLRQSWDVLIYSSAYDMNFTDVVGIIQERNIDLPLISLMSEESASSERNSEGLPITLNERMIKSVLANDETQVVVATRLLHNNVQARRKIAELNYILSEAEQRASILIKNSKSAVAYIDQGMHIYANDTYLDMFGFNSLDELLGVPVIDLIAGGENVKAFKQFLRRFDKGNRDEVEFNFESRRKDNSTFEATLQLAAATFEGEPVTQIIIQQNDSGNAEEIAKALAVAERIDSLTGLLNRRGFEQQLASTYKEAKSGSLTGVLMYVRMDNIGKINSNLGLQGVDETVKQVGSLLKESFPKGTVSRFNGNNFAILQTGVAPEALIKHTDNVRQKASKMLIEVGTRTVTTTLTIGMVSIDQSSPEMMALINRVMETAKQAFIDSKNEGNTLQFYDPSQHAKEDEVALLEYLQNALSKSQFKLMYQPIYDIETDSSNFFEVYLRLPLADGTLMTPDQFFPVATRHNLMEKIDRWVLINACKQLNIIRKQAPDTRILVQLTKQSLASNKLSGMVSQLINAVGGQPNALTVQFNEQELIDHMSVAKKQFEALKKVGCCVGIHHFGSTAKTVSVMEYVEPTMVRLARNYVKDFGEVNNIDTVKALISTANEHNTAVLMPYIEDAAVMSAAWSVGARYLQGYYLQEPTEQMTVVQGG